MAGFRPNTSISSFLVGPNSSASRVRACQVMPSTCIVYSFLPLVERVGGRFPPLHMVPAVKSWRELLSLRFNQEEFCDELYIHRKSPRLLSSRIQAAVLIAG